jgi:hypothetical protein
MLLKFVIAQHRSIDVSTVSIHTGIKHRDIGVLALCAQRENNGGALNDRNPRESRGFLRLFSWSP